MAMSPRTVSASSFVLRLVGAFFLVWFLATAPNQLARAAEQTLTSEQDKVAKSLDNKLIAPCCFQGTLAEHQSPIATQLRGELRTLIAKGEGEQEILDYFVGKYGERILAAPRVRGFNLLAYVMPVVGLAVGSVLILLLFRHAIRRRGAEPVGTSRSETSAPVFDESLRARFQEELKHFEG